MYALVQKRFGALRPANEDAENLIKKLKDGIEYKCEITRPRNIKFFRKYWVLCGIIAENYPAPITKETVSDIIKVEAGHVRIVKIGNIIHAFPDSISFQRMTEDEWESFWPRAVQVCCEKIIPGLDNNEVEQEILELTK
jgi:hypothetical protein